MTGIDLTPAFCDAAAAMSAWVGLDKLTSFEQGDATKLPFADRQFDAAMTIHVAMNIAVKDRMYTEARRVLKPGGVFLSTTCCRGGGGDLLYPVPWAREPLISHLATPEQMQALLTGAGFRLLTVKSRPTKARASLKNDRADGANGQTAGGLAAVPRRRFPGGGAKSGAQCARTAHPEHDFHLRRISAEPSRRGRLGERISRPWQPISSPRPGPMPARPSSPPG